MGEGWDKGAKSIADAFNVKKKPVVASDDSNMAQGHTKTAMDDVHHYERKEDGHPEGQGDDDAVGKLLKDKFKAAAAAPEKSLEQLEAEKRARDGEE